MDIFHAKTSICFILESLAYPAIHKKYLPWKTASHFNLYTHSSGPCYSQVTSIKRMRSVREYSYGNEEFLRFARGFWCPFSPSIGINVRVPLSCL